MRRKTAFVLCGIALVVLPVLTVASVIPGDINSDGVVNAIDVQLIINAALGIDISDAIPVPEGPDTLTIKNLTSHTIEELYLVHDGESTWGLNRLAGSSIAPEGTFTISDVLPDNYDLAAGVGVLGELVYVYELGVPLGEQAMTWQVIPDMLQPNTFILHNEISQNIERLHFSSSQHPEAFNVPATSSGTPNLLSQDVGPGSSVTVEGIPNGKIKFNWYFNSAGGQRDSGGASVTLTGGQTSEYWDY